MNNGTFRTFTFLCLVVIGLLALSLLPELEIGGYEVKRTDLLADIRICNAEEADMSVPSAASLSLKSLRDTCPAGTVCIEDYSDTTGHGMQPFYEAIARRRTLGRPVRIAYFGDSFIEGDILTADLRALLQQKFGGCGVGFVDISSPFTKLRASVSAESHGCTEHNVLEKGNHVPAYLGISQRYALPTGHASVELRGSDAFARLDSFETATLYLATRRPLSVSVISDGQPAGRMSAQGTGRVESLCHEQRAGQVRFDVNDGDRAICYGVALEGHEGITLDNFSLRGSSGTPLRSVSENHLKQMYAVRPYDLVVLQFGLNVANKEQMKYTGYIAQMKRVIDHFKHCFPGAGILVVSIGDREDRHNGRIETIPAIPALVREQQDMAIADGVAFWNLFEGMGGKGAMLRMAQARPAEAGKDYTHINRRGGARIARKLYKALLHGYEQYEKRNTYENHP
ncbi:MAG: hypothetical protein IJY00_02670 [Bacteroidaceae bacterium]|nr:hypothetical protein [Bacteroidaceae bacterium]